MDSIQGLLTDPAAPVEILPTLFNFVLCLVVAFVLRSFYIHRSLALTGKQHIGSILPLLAGITFLVIIVVKSSLALSLGLVGALSIVRFRTPIKEPEELVYLFLAIAIGLGYAAGQTVITTLIVTLIFGVINSGLAGGARKQGREYNLVLDWQDKNVSASHIVEAVSEQTTSNEVVKYTSENGQHSLVLRIDMSDLPFIDKLTDRLRNMDRDVRVNFFESAALW